MSVRDYAVLEANGLAIDAWTSYSFQSDLFTPADSFRLTLGVGTSNSRDTRANIARLKERIAPGTKVRLYVGSGSSRALQGVCIVDAVEVQNDANGGTVLTVDGRDQAAFLIRSAADPGVYAKDDTLVSVARKAVAPWGIEVTADHVAGRDLRQARVRKDKMRRLQDKARSYGIPPAMLSEKLAASIDRGTISIEDFVEAAGSSLDQARATRLGVPFSGGAPGLSALAIYQLKVKDVRPQSGETVWEFLDRHAQRNGLLMSFDPQGRLVFAGLEYNQPPSYRLVRRMRGATHENNILSGGARHDLSDVYQRIDVYGRAKGGDAFRSAFHGIAEDASVPYPLVRRVYDSSIKTQDDAQTRAEYELARSRQGALGLRYTVAGHSADGAVFATDSIAYVLDEVAGLDGPYYITARTFTRSASAGALTELTLVPPGSIVLREAA